MTEKTFFLIFLRKKFGGSENFHYLCKLIGEFGSKRRSRGRGHPRTQEEAKKTRGAKETTKETK